VMAPRTVLL
nr:Chain P, Peptide VMAPRTVLL [synthetic construct]1KPR_Q Chain Q, Peptide VMAPRTVLL [synthetic construct]1MHE_P Chain P, PEPTIDE (VMAPRTVLL) [unidentified]1MHE_Q Chain Q, PEPTIDE (VMAPRTVLL) [unidentified]7BH8_P Chain P, VL9 leader peptide [Homo sapiens]7BH8_Q Chain Q, VL9 leader peptide [Homo sapiens]